MSDADLRCDICMRAVAPGKGCPEHPYADLLDPQYPDDQQLIALRHQMSADNARALVATVSAFVILVPTGILFAMLNPIGATLYAIASTLIVVPSALLLTGLWGWLRRHT